jgi:hypothetical protein
MKSPPRKQIRARDEVLKQREQTLIEWLREESPDQTQLTFSAESARSSSPLGQFIERALANGTKHTTEELTELVRSDVELNAKYEGKPARAINFTLQGWKRYGHINQDASGRWHFKEGR